ncbi:MAG: hypothetical protein KDA63_10880 [Planctomycetales bacterium]|nr:hypothetical protein [Planctomycetales bacterium]
MANHNTSKPRFQRLPKKDRDEVTRLHELIRQNSDLSLHGDLKSYLQVRTEFLETVFACPPRDPPVSREMRLTSDLLSAFHYAEMHSFGDGMIQRLVDNDPALQAAGFSLASRFSLLHWRDRHYVYGILKGLAAKDDFAVLRSVKRLPRLAPTGHTSTVLLCEALCMVLRRDKDAFHALGEKLQSRNHTKLYQGMYKCLSAIMHGSPNQVSESLLMIAAAARHKKSYVSSLERVVSYEAHALFNLAVDEFSERNIAAPIPPAHMAWDTEYQRYIEQTPVDRSRLIDLAAMSPTLHSWVEELPDDIQIRDLLLETSRVDEVTDPSQPYTALQLRRLSPDAEPFRGEVCPACRFYIPRFEGLDDAAIQRIRALGVPQGAAELITQTGCPRKFALIWMNHPNGPREPSPLHLPAPPCPHCGKKLATALARQCLHCGADWH